MPNIAAQRKRLLVDSMLLALCHFQDGEHVEAAKVMQQASEMSDVDQVVDDINQDHKDAAEKEHEQERPAGGEQSPPPAGSEPGKAGDEVVDNDDGGAESDDADMDEADDAAVQARIKEVSAKLRKARDSGDTKSVRAHSRRIWKLHSKLNARRKKAEAEAAAKATKAVQVPQSPASRQAAAMANLNKLATKK